MMWRRPPQAPRRWLPAYTVYGEGIFLELREDRLRNWEKRPEVLKRIEHLQGTYSRTRTLRGLWDRLVPPRLLLLHTLAHALMNQLTFDCGYSTASLRERFYVSNDQNEPMAGVLIYTSAGDSEGTMGGLVRMGKPDHLEVVVAKALRNARWCSADPVCMELDARGGQGPDSCNLAACHNCSLAPETSCEEFNKLLDRGLLVGTLEQRDLGFMADLN